MHRKFQLDVAREPRQEAVGIGQLKKRAVAAPGVMAPRVQHQTPGPPLKYATDGPGWGVQHKLLSRVGHWVMSPDGRMGHSTCRRVF